MKNFINKHYSKLISILLVISCVPVIITGILSYIQSSDAIMDLSNTEKQQNIKQIQSNVEQVLKYVELSTVHFINSGQAEELLNKDINRESYIDIRKLNNDLAELQNVDYGIEDIVFANLDERWLINNNGIILLNKETTNRIYNTYLNGPGKTHWFIEDWDQITLPNETRNNCSQYIYLVKKLPLNSTKSTGLISIFMPSCKLTNIMTKSKNQESFMILDQHRQIIAHSNPEYTGDFQTIPEPLINKITQTNMKNQFNFSHNDTAFKVTHHTSDYNNWTYISFVKIDDLQEKSNSIGWLTLLVVSVLLMISIAFAYIGSNVIYKPIKKLRNSICSNVHPVDQDKNEFEMIESHIDKLLNHNSQLTKKTQNHVTQLKQLFMIRLLQGKINDDEINYKLKTYKYPDKWNWLICFSIKIDAINQKKFNENDQDLILFAINNLLEDLIPIDQRLSPIVFNETQTTIILIDSDNDTTYTKKINQTVETIQQKVQEYFNINISIGISNRFKHLIETEKAYQESNEALKYRLKTKDSSVIFYKNLDRSYSKLAPYPTAIINKILDSIKISDYQNASKETMNLFEFIERNNIKHQHLTIILSRFLYELFELKELLGIHLEDLDSLDMINHYHSLKSLEETKRWIMDDVVQTIIIRLDAKNNNKEKNISDKVIQFIKENYNTKITLDIIAEHLHYNPNYLGNIFQKETDCTFSEYLINYRISKAKLWLLSTDMSVKDIALQLQYKNSQNFIRSFRKLEGITPGKYRLNFKSINRNKLNNSI
ncbi:helix-turn-helix domain-containing protein [Gracilibacillus sp. D59]|uniref:helix-turn-helix domain-containing protein n=1 Tax=Gracilibacillus sp. D59 TaxID=3457434 RepID=UPI003FCD0862